MALEDRYGSRTPHCGSASLWALPAEDLTVSSRVRGASLSGERQIGQEGIEETEKDMLRKRKRDQK